MVAAVRHAIDLRMQESSECLSAPGVGSYLEELRQFHRKHDPEIMEEVAGIGNGFGIPEDRLFDYLMLSLVENFTRTGGEADECTAFACSAGEGGVILAKNRDYRREHVPLQRVFRHRDPDWSGREVLCVGSLGSPGNFSSGMNSDGFAIADTASRTRANQVGRHRYFLLTRLLCRCSTVCRGIGRNCRNAACRRRHGDPGGCFRLHGRGGTRCTSAVTLEIQHAGWLGRTNHYVGNSTAMLNRVDDAVEDSHRNSERRLTTLRGLLAGEPEKIRMEAAAEILSYRGQNGDEALCRKGGKDLSETISGCIYATGQKLLWFANGNPSSGDWCTFSFGGSGG